MNKCSLVGRLTRDIDLRYTTGQNQMAVARFNLAVNRRGKDKGADFISCVAFGKTAETLEQYVKKGHRLGIVGHIQTGSYDHKNGYKVYTTDVIVDEFDFLESSQKNDAPSQDASEQTTYENLPEGFHEIDDDDVPF